MKVSILGGCNPRNAVKNAAIDNDIIVEPYCFFPCLLDITKPGLEIPYKYFINLPIIAGHDETAGFTKKTMQYDLNKRFLSTIESLNPDYIILDLPTLIFETYKISYNNRSVYSVNSQSPACYEYLKTALPELIIEKAVITDELVYQSLDILIEYIKNNWGIEKLILFKNTAPLVFIDKDNTIRKYPSENYEFERLKKINEYTEYVIEKLPGVKVFEDSKIKIGVFTKTDLANNIPLPPLFHVTDDTQKLQGLLMRSFLLHENLEPEISKYRQSLQKQIQEGLSL